MKRTSLTLILLLAVAGTLVACTPADVERSECLQTDLPVYDVPSDHDTPWPSSMLVLANGTTIDARGEVFDNTDRDASGFGIGVKYHAKPGTRDSLCMIGGTISTTLHHDDTAWSIWHRVTALTVEIDNFTVVGTQFVNNGDAISFVGAENWRVVGVRADGAGRYDGAYIHDDCVENDSMESGVIEDSKFDGCNTFLSSQSSIDGSGNTVVVSGSLVRLQAYRNSYNVPKYGEYKHGGFFKWSNPTQT